VKRGRKSKKVGRDKYAGAHVQVELLEDITPEVINRFLADRMKMDCWSPKTVNLTRQVLHQLFAYAIKHHGFRSRDRRYPNPVAGVDRLREPAPQIRFLSLDGIEAQLEAVADSPVIRAMVAVYIYAGLRREEALWLTRDDVDLGSRLMRVQAKTINGESWQPKTKRNRVVPVSSDLHSVLESYVSPSECAWYFPSPTGKRWDPDNFSQDLRKINTEHGLDWSCLDFRHTFGSHLAQKGESHAALIPEQMQDTVEFRKPSAAEPRRDTEVKELMERLLEKLGDEGKERQPRLRLIRGGSR